MRDRLIATLGEKEAFLKVEKDLLKAAKELYDRGFLPKHLSKSQMSAITECLRQADSIFDAKKNAKVFLQNQLNKLAAKSGHSGKKISWAKEASGTGEQNSLGRLLINWFKNEEYLKGASLSESNRLHAIQLVWNFVFRIYNYRKVMGEGMSF